ncbi:MAG: sugar phosphate isomerase/epimerase [Verrucomicrobiae bacterium]|nr:sugar phosphate isomerase/epimerase [Verrucomicrobiae bacterium]
MNKLAIISAFLGGVRNRYMQYHPERTFAEKIALAAKTQRVDGLELCFPADFEDFKETKCLLEDNGLGVPSINVRSRRQGRWLRGSFTSESEQERQEVIDEFKQAADYAVELGSPRISTCPLNDGHDYVFEMNYLDAYRYAEESFAAICEYNRDIKVCIEYKWNDPRTRCMFGTAAETISFAEAVGADNLGAVIDFGHSIQAGERPAQALAQLRRAGRLFYVHLNDNDRQWDWDMLPGAYHFWESIEFFYYLKEVGYTDDWIAYDVLSKEIDPVEHFNLVTKLTRKLESFADRIDREKITAIMRTRNPVTSLEYLYDLIN